MQFLTALLWQLQSWPTDAAVIFRLFNIQSQKLEDFGIKNIACGIHLVVEKTFKNTF